MMKTNSIFWNNRIEKNEIPVTSHLSPLPKSLRREGYRSDDIKSIKKKLKGKKKGFFSGEGGEIRKRNDIRNKLERKEKEKEEKKAAKRMLNSKLIRRTFPIPGQKRLTTACFPSNLRLQPCNNTIIKFVCFETFNTIRFYLLIGITIDYVLSKLEHT